VPEQQYGLQRKLGLFPVTNIVVANMIGAGIFTTSGLLMADLQSPLLMVSLWIVGGVFAFCGALSYGALGSAMPDAGGEYIFLSKLYHPMAGFLSGWVSLIVGFSAPIAASAMGFSAYFSRAFPQITAWSAGGLMTPAGIEKLLSIAVIVLFTLIHLRRIEFGARIQNYLTILKVGLVVGLLFIGLVWGTGNTDHFARGEAFSFDFSGWKTIGLSIMWIMFGYSGWNAAAYIGAEIRDPQKILPRSLLLGTGIVIILYFGLNFLYVYAIPPSDMSGVIAIGALAVENLFGGPVETVFSLLISFALFSSLSAFLILGPRVYYAMARDGYFFKSIAEVHPDSKVPHKAILLQSGIAVIMVLSGSFDQILTYMGFSLGIFPILAVIGVFKLKAKGGVQVPGFPVIPVIYIVSALSILLLAYFERPLESSIAIATVILGIPVYVYFKRTQ
jgi:APA family basic amino acid/polyamine antiporter